MQRGSDVWAWTGYDTAFERGKVDRIEAHKGVIHVKLDKGGKFDCIRASRLPYLDRPQRCPRRPPREAAAPFCACSL